MFHTILVFLNIIILPVLSIIINLIINYQKNITEKFYEVIGKWFIFWSLGIRLVIAGLMQLVNPAYTNNLLQLGLSDFIIIRELGLANLSIGLLCTISFIKKSLQGYVCLYMFIYFTGASILHILRIGSINFDEFITLITNVILVIIALYGIIYSIKIRRLKK
jgi:hypothetical protein